MPFVYLIHFDRPLHHANHYIGYCKGKPEDRFKDHKSGNGANILRVLNVLGIDYKIVRVWQKGTRKLERKLKNRKKARQLCPVCKLTKENHDHR